MTSLNLINVESLIVLGYVSRLHRDKVGRLCHSVHNNPYGVMLPTSVWKKNHEVRINGLPLPSRNLDNLSHTASLKMLCLNLLTIRTPSHILRNILLHAIPQIDMLKIMIHLC